MWRRAVWQERMDILEDLVASNTIHPDNGGNMTHWDVGTSVPEYMSSYPRRKRYAVSATRTLSYLLYFNHTSAFVPI